MRNKEDLFHLIKSMSRAEKRHFTTMQNNGGSEVQYMKLYSSINRMEEYDEEALANRYTGLSDLKRYLYEAILRAMRDYKFQRSLSAQVKAYLQDARYLYEMALYDQSEERLLKAKDIAQRIDDQCSLLEINKELRRITKMVRDKEMKSKLLTLIAEQQNIQRHIEEELFFLQAYDELIAESIRSYHLTGENKIKAFREKYKSLLSENTAPEYLRAQLRYYQSKAILGQLSRKHDEKLSNFQQVLSLWEKNGDYQVDEFYRFIMDFSNLISANVNQDKYDEVDRLCKKMEKLKPSSFHEEALLFRRVTHYKLLVKINKGIDSSELEDFVSSVEKGIVRYRVSGFHQLHLLLNMGILLLFQGKYEGAIEWVEKMMGNRNIKIRPDLYFSAHLVRVFACISWEETVKTEASIRSVRYYMSQYPDTILEGEIQLLSLVSQIDRAPAAEKKAAFASVLSFLEENNNSSLIRTLVYGVAKSWAQAGVAGCTVSEIDLFPDN